MQEDHYCYIVCVGGRAEVFTSVFPSQYRATPFGFKIFYRHPLIEPESFGGLMYQPTKEMAKRLILEKQETKIS
jgi:hypothetical protein